MRRLSGENLKKNHMIFFFNNCCLNIVIFHSYFVIAIIVFSLVDKGADFSNLEVVGSNPGSVIFFIFFYFFSFSFLNT